MIKRTDTKAIYVKDVQIGHQNKVVIQTMTHSKTANTEAVIAEINTYATHGAEIVRLAIVDQADALAIQTLKKATTVPLVADIHFDYRLALLAIENGIDKIRFNPGNIGNPKHIQAIVEACKKAQIPIRVGINAGSLEKNILERYGKTAQAMVESAKHHIAHLEALDFYDIAVSLKASDVALTIESNILASQTFAYPLHIGLTEAGPVYQGTITSSAALGTLLYHGIGDTIRISLSGPRIEELKACKTLLTAYNLYQAPRIVSCPGCGRLSYDMQSLLQRIDDYLAVHDIPLTLAIMGCAVNGPGEAKDADLGVAGGNGEGLIFAKGRIIKKVPEATLYEELIALLAHHKKM